MADLDRRNPFSFALPVETRRAQYRRALVVKNLKEKHALESQAHFIATRGAGRMLGKQRNNCSRFEVSGGDMLGSFAAESFGDRGAATEAVPSPEEDPLRLGGSGHGDGPEAAVEAEPAGSPAAGGGGAVAEPEPEALAVEALAAQAAAPGAGLDLAAGLDVARLARTICVIGGPGSGASHSDARVTPRRREFGRATSCAAVLRFACWSFVLAGRGTLCARLVAEFPQLCVHVSIGAALRAHAAGAGEVSEEIGAVMRAGEMVAHGTVAAVLVAAVAEARGRCPEDATLLLDGYPLTVEQANQLPELEGIGEVTATVLLDCPEAEMVRRVLGRAKQGRADDTEETVLKLIDRFTAQTLPVRRSSAQRSHHHHHHHHHHHWQLPTYRLHEGAAAANHRRSQCCCPGHRFASRRRRPASCEVRDPTTWTILPKQALITSDRGIMCSLRTKWP